MKLQAPQTYIHWAQPGLIDSERITRLGILGYLPWEVRQQIWREVLCSAYWSADGVLSYLGPGCPFGLQNYDGSPYIANSFYLKSISNLYETSSDVDAEFKSMFLSTNQFQFACARNLAYFLDCLSSTQRCQIFHFNICLFTCPVHIHGSCIREWISVFERIPSELRSVRFRIGKMAQKDRGYSLWLFDDLNKRVRRNAPKAMVSIISRRRSQHRTRETAAFEALVDDVETCSEESIAWLMQEEPPESLHGPTTNLQRSTDITTQQSVKEDLHGWLDGGLDVDLHDELSEKVSRIEYWGGLSRYGSRHFTQAC